MARKDLLHIDDGVKVARFLLFSFTILSFLIVLVFGFVMDFRAGYESLVFNVSVGLGIVIIAHFAFSYLQFYLIRGLVEVIIMGYILTLVIVISMYMAGRFNMPLIDDRLSAIDQAMGFSGKNFLYFLDSYPFLEKIFFNAYQSFMPQILGWLIILICLGHIGRAYAAITAYGVLCLIASIISIFLPASGLFVHYEIQANSFQNINTYFGIYHLDDFNALRNDPDFFFSFSQTKGIISFPSVHASVAIWSIWTSWAVKPLRFFSVVGNVLMMISAITHGGHYLIDVVAGIANGVFSIAMIVIITDFLTKKKRNLRFNLSNF
ncbi:phosphatase PAP2 family protein [Candidatus Liberibacter sp.]|uniref:phosphatase PAP2 family protein n=1 Tax=Candidatus Liberibacter sp. TaxID=34022 RepID=UPI0015F3B300|nr:phosphatase PAP2 family protein [Candidatus Liberibacter sp.]MBA5723790.1 phosphatase PAP2 family protein [Candidatus Liberibacter sp.]